MSKKKLLQSKVNESKNTLEKYKNHPALKNIVSLTKEEKKKKIKNAYIVSLIFVVGAIILVSSLKLSGFLYYLTFVLAGLFGVAYYLVGKTPVIDEKSNKRKRKSLDEEFLEQLEEEKRLASLEED